MERFKAGLMMKELRFIHHPKRESIWHNCKPLGAWLSISADCLSKDATGVYQGNVQDVHMVTEGAAENHSKGWRIR